MRDRHFHSWQEQQAHGDRDAMPDIRLLWQRTSTARKPYICCRCNEPINIGDKYESIGWREDGDFHHDRQHYAAGNYPSGCPSIGLKDRAELEAQFALDQEEYFP